ncbi:sugar ABC transporter permease [Rathayibacter sp. AY1C6]|uniref:carbohydrate ABC transporter permease n=1 Tax=Rathayibacter sp. AY1C6 TaxID=2080539 RepID=UPI000CE7F460|nr:carbohydrate ABC transporter permease [Rathayibacter sp. AY1C6]PPG18135.1 sugar ABC transporter permease [Rathayibacter sp. AY1C6]
MTGTRPPRTGYTVSRRAGSVIHNVIAVIGTAVVIGIPLWLLVITSGKSTADSASPDLSLPTTWHFVENYAQAITQGGVLAAMGGSLLVTIPSVLLVLGLGSAAAWVLARRSSRLTSVLYSIGISGIILPPAVIMIVLTLKSIGLDGTLVGAIGVYGGSFMATAIFFITGFVRSIPLELEEAARIDGAGPVGVFFRVILPLLQPVLATAAILVTISVWNEVFYAFFILSGGPISTMPLGLFNVASQSEYVRNWNLIFAYVVIMSIPMVVAFVIGQRRIIAGVTSGAVK